MRTITISAPIGTVTAYRLLSGHWQVRNANGYGSSVSPSRDEQEARDWVIAKAPALVAEANLNEAKRDLDLAEHAASLADPTFQALKNQAMESYVRTFGTASE